MRRPRGRDRLDTRGQGGPYVSLVTLSEVHKSYGNQDVLQGRVRFFIAPGPAGRTDSVPERAAGKNGPSCG